MGFLADVESPSARNPIVFDKEKYDYGSNYNTRTGVYRVPYDGLYLIHVRVYGEDYKAHHFIYVDGTPVINTYRYDPDYQWQSSSTSAVLHLKSGQEVEVQPGFRTGTIGGNPSSMTTYFGATLLYPLAV